MVTRRRGFSAFTANRKQIHLCVLEADLLGRLAECGSFKQPIHIRFIAVYQFPIHDMIHKGFVRVARVEIAKNQSTARTQELVRVIAEFCDQLIVEVIDETDRIYQVLWW